MFHVSGATAPHVYFPPAMVRQAPALGAVEESAHAPVFSGVLQSRFTRTNDVEEDDRGGFQLDVARFAWDWRLDHGLTATLRLEAGDPMLSDTVGPDFGLLDAYATVDLSEHASAFVGRFSSTVLWSSGLGEDTRPFLEKTFLGEVLDGRDVGVEVTCAIDRWNVWAGLQNGSDEGGDGLALSARASCNVLGSELPASECLRLPAESTRLTAAVGWFDDTGLDDGTLVAADLFFAAGRWSASFEGVDFGDGVRPLLVTNPATAAIVPGGAGPTGARRAWNATATCVIEPDTWSIAARWQAFDDPADVAITSASLVHHTRTSGARWVLQVERARSDDGSLERETAALGLILGF